MDFLQYLMRGGSYGHFWLKKSVRTVWWPVSDIPQIPIASEDVYFGVHPSRISKGPKERTLLEDVQAINCLYADFDAKDFENSKQLVVGHLKELDPLPSVIIDSGNGYHCYWLLDEPFILDTELRVEIARDMQKRWVIHVGGDLAVHDLARIMRPPGTKNYKYDPPRPVRTLREQLDKTFNLEEILEYLPDLPPGYDPSTQGDDEVDLPGVAQPNDLSDQAVIDLALASANGQKFRRLFKNISSDYASTSEADLAFAAMLAFWTGGDHKKIDRIFRASDRMRPKWDRKDYRVPTLIKAILQTKEFYIDPGGLLSAGAHDEGNASCVYAKVKDEIAYCGALGWLQYRDGHWNPEMAETAVQIAIIKTLKERRKAAVEAQDEDVLRAARPTAVNVHHCQQLLRPKVDVPIAEFDVGVDELNCANGVVNLRTGKLQQHSRKRMFTYRIGSDYDQDADSSYWEKWLLHTTGGRQDVADFLQLAVGYTLTGHVSEEIMFYIHGPARAGKGIFTETLIALLGGRPLATEVDIDMFMSKKYNSGGVNFSLATLKAARFVAASESRENEWLNAKRVKRWTGRNYITCAHKYQQDFTYVPQFKIWLTSNFPPQMDADDAAAWGRLRIMEFPVSHLGIEDKTLKSKMVAPDMLRGILAWAVRGSMGWYKLGREGLITPDTVKHATEQARVDVDWVSAWVAEAVKKTDSDDDRVPSDIYYTEYKSWCQDNGVSPKSLRSLNRSLREAGFSVSVPTRIGGQIKRCWTGVRVSGFGQGLRGKPISEEAANVQARGSMAWTKAEAEIAEAEIAEVSNNNQ